MNDLPMIDCDAVIRQLWDYLDGELTPDRLAALEAHIKMCERCAPHVAFERSFKSALRAARHAPLDTTGLCERIRTALRAEGFADSR
ncbi:MAG: zf-HC2 domain-containing protein [Gemmatimonadaceae bacterium]